MRFYVCTAVLLGLLTLGLSGVSSPAHAGTITVQNTADSGPGSLRQAVADAVSGDTINFAPVVIGTIALNSTLVINTKVLNIVGPGASKLVLSGNDAVTILQYHYPASASPISISGLTFANGYDSTFGGAAVRSYGTLNLSDCVFRDNVTTQFGGALLCDYGDVNVTRCSFINNEGSVSGAIYVQADDANLIIDGCRFTGNIASFNGAGAISLLAAGLTIRDSSFTDNRGITAGAVMFAGNLEGGSSTISRSTFNNNRATTSPIGGGRAGALAAVDLTLNHCTLSGNIAEGDGAYGGALVRFGNLTINNCTIAGNSAPGGKGGGISTDEGTSNSGTTTIYSSIISGNTAASAPDISGAITSQDYNLIQNTSGATITGNTTHDKYGVDPLLAPLANNGGPTPTRALLAGSPAIDGGNPAEAASTDQRGLPRRRDGDGNGSAISDIGAFEVQSTVAVSGRVSTSNGIGVVGATVTLGGLSVQSNGAGYFLFAAVPPGGYVVRPSHQNLQFTPGSRTVYVASTAVSGQNFVGGHSIQGRIYNSSGVGVVNVKVTRSGSVTPVYTNSAGYYTFSTLVPGSYTITPSQAGFSLAPANRTVDVSNGSATAQNFVASSGYSVIGRISTSAGRGIAGVTVTLSSGATAVSNSAGYYTFHNIPNGTYTLTPAKSGMVFAPVSRNVTVNGSNVSGYNFIGSNS